MLEPETAAAVPDWNKRKLAQWASITDMGLAGMQLVRSGPGQSTFMLIRSTPEFYEGVIIGRLPHKQTVFAIVDGKPTSKRVPEDKKSPERRGIDLSDEQVEQIIDRWGRRQTAFDLPFVHEVHLRDGTSCAKQS